MSFDFDRIISRHGTNALSAEGFESYLFGGGENAAVVSVPRSDLISMWVADMQFAVPPAAIDAMTERLKHPIFGYTMNFDDGLYDVFGDWCLKRYDWRVEREEMQVSLGVIPALFSLVDYICAPNEGVLTLTPAYGYFKHAANQRGRTLVTSPLLEVDGSYAIDFCDFEQKASDPAVKLFFLCHPHNPTGRVWTDEELRRLGEICIANGVKIVSDEIHCDLLRKDRRHTPLTKLFPGCRDIITCMAVSKTFNLAGMMIATVVIPDADLRAVWRKHHYPFVNPISLAAAIGVYRNGEPWLEELRDYLDGNFALVSEFLRWRLPQADFQIPDATYLAWVDLSAYLPASLNLTRFFIETAGVILEGGEMFVENGRQRIRLNLASPRSQVLRGLERICDAISSLRSPAASDRLTILTTQNS
ncbi:putative C-S lyase [Rhizobium sp. RMa-01]|uniref:MalY/PatB family protein n=1 Tax=unclassified Rhizobium TaxID=2613769 RepID=UPI0008D9593B|nr:MULTISPECIES: PatB family C-S lyase [unclassified Rhizobium]OHV24722.1 aminotransferase [Rhizobium sp. RSm-3]RVU08753.1 putative C-S lyase [Rhizobium sp. RMa-01]